MRVRTKANVIVSSDADGKNKLFAPDDTLAEIVLDGCQEVSSGQVGVAALASFTVPLGGLTTALGVYLHADQDFDLVLDGRDPIQVRRGPTGSGTFAGAAVFLAHITAITVTATALTDALVLRYCLWGEPVA